MGRDKQVLGVPHRVSRGDGLLLKHIQRQQGFDLERYAGKPAKRYTYEILNYPSGETGVQANLLLYKTTVIGGEVLSPRLDGFLHGLAMPETGDAGG